MEPPAWPMGADTGDPPTALQLPTAHSRASDAVVSQFCAGTLFNFIQAIHEQPCLGRHGRGAAGLRNKKLYEKKIVRARPQTDFI